MRIKRKDITIEQYKMWFNHNCDRQCNTRTYLCPFFFFPCQIDDGNCWVYNKEKFNGNSLITKEMFNEWLEEEIEIYGYRGPTDEEREKIKFILNSLGYPLKVRWVDIEMDKYEDGVEEERLTITGFTNETKRIKDKKITIEKSIDIYIPLKGDEFDCISKNHEYTLEELGIKWGGK